MSRRRQLLETVERVTGVALRPLGDVTRLEETEMEYRGRLRELQDAAYAIMEYAGGSPAEMKAVERRKLAQKARLIWQQDPQYGGTVNMLNEFVLGRGIGTPTANDADVQREIDEFWEDHDNQRVLTTHAAQVRFNTDLSLQSNVFIVCYDDGEDGKVKLSVLDHDSVEAAVCDPAERRRVLYYFTKQRTRKWDVTKHGYEVSLKPDKLRYYEEFRNLQDVQEEAADGGASRQEDEELPDIPANLKARGRVYHVAINRTGEQIFGIPEIARTVRWLTAYNDLMRARVDMAKAAASIIMRRKLKGATEATVAMRKLLSEGSSVLSPVTPDEAMAAAPSPGSIIEENESVSHEAFSLNSGSASAMQDAQMIRSQYSVATGWPQSYLGDPSATPLSTGTTLELRVLKMVETRGQVIEDTLQALIDHKIQRATEIGRLTKFRPMTEDEREQQEREAADAQDAHNVPLAAAAQGDAEEEPPEGMVLRDLSYQIPMPSPLRRAMGDLITAVGNIAKTFDPNNTNLELSKLLLGIALGEGMEVDDPAAAVERIFPEGYVDPAVAAAAAPPELPPGSFEDGSLGADGERHGEGNPYGAPMAARPAEQVMQQAADLLSDRYSVVLHDRGGEPMPRGLQEALVRRGNGGTPTKAGAHRSKMAAARQSDGVDLLADELLGPALAKALELVS